ncbi:MAG: hypothetical protein HC887_00855 [Desulfobacteraceae bacterium]|nr:hypothetical protein [Desulfobacteraceae bacterium]
MIGESGSGKTTTLRHSGLRCLENIPFVREVEEEKQACNFRFFERGLVLDIAGDLVLRKKRGQLR